MLNHKVLDEINAKISQVLAASPAGDVEKNLRASLQGLFSRLDLVTREEFEVQQAVLVRTRENWTGWRSRWLPWKSNSGQSQSNNSKYPPIAAMC